VRCRKGLSPDVGLSGLVETFQVKKKNQRIDLLGLGHIVTCSRASGYERASAFRDTAGHSGWSW